MKRILLLSAATVAIAITGEGMQAHAGSPNKDSRIMNDVSRMEPAAGEHKHYYDNSYDASPYDDFTGPYVGGEIGYAFTDDLDGWNGGVFAGYGFVHEFDMLGAYAGAEIGYEWGGADGSVAGVPYEKDRAWNFTFRPGAKISEDGLGYGIIGYSRAEFESASGGDDLDGLILGLGGQFDTNTALKTRLEYTWTNYESANLSGTSFDPNEHAVKVGAVFQF